MAVVGKRQKLADWRENKMGYNEGKNIGEAYVEALKTIVNGRMTHWYLTVHILQPIRDSSMKQTISSFEIKDWLGIINVGDEVFQAFVKFQFSKSDGWTAGNAGEDWINGRIRDLLDPHGYYNKALRSGYPFDQLVEVENRLSARDKKGKRMHGGSTNALVCHVFLPEKDLKTACLPRPRSSGLRCLAMLDFKPIRDVLNLMAVFRSQYFDTKAYGNFIALAMLLYNMCQKTGYKPGAIVSTANKVTFNGHKDSLYEHFRSMGIV